MTGHLDSGERVVIEREAWLSHPDEWCEDCMYGEGTLAGDIHA